MARAMFFTLIVLAAGAGADRAEAQQPPLRVPVFLDEGCDADLVGKRVAYHVREGLNKATTMVVADRYLDSVIQLSLVCLDPEGDEKGSVSRYSYAITFLNRKGHYDYLLTHGVGTCGARRVADCAENIVVSLAGAIRDLLDKVQKGELEYDPS